jgi:hypothetical protein
VPTHLLHQTTLVTLARSPRRWQHLQRSQLLLRLLRGALHQNAPAVCTSASVHAALAGVGVTPPSVVATAPSAQLAIYDSDQVEPVLLWIASLKHRLWWW